MKAQYADTLAQAVSGAFRRLTSEQRNLLRLYVIDELSLAELGRLHAVDASTISRWLTKIRARLLEEAQAELLERHALRPSECASVMRLVRSDLHLSIAACFNRSPPGPSRTDDGRTDRSASANEFRPGRRRSLG
jgi:RNA polymerase sigma-70 factor (ECF subfamily)